jgi:hypothetical protein
VVIKKRFRGDCDFLKEKLTPKTYFEEWKGGA